MKTFRLMTTVRLGAEALSALDQFRGESVFLVTDEFLTTTPIFRRVLEHLGDQVSMFTGVLPNPATKEIGLGVSEYVKAKPHVVVAYGGGSVMDAAKVMHKAALDAGFGAPAGIVAIPTTSGSGSEVTSFAVVTDEETHVKVPIVSDDMVARLAILDPHAVVGAPSHITADSGMDALTHAIEAYVARDACDFSDALVEKATELIFANLARCHSHGEDLEARTHMHNASCMAAMAFDNVGLGITHSLAHALGGHHPHRPWAAERHAAAPCDRVQRGTLRNRLRTLRTTRASPVPVGDRAGGGCDPDRRGASPLRATRSSHEVG